VFARSRQSLPLYKGDASMYEDIFLDVTAALKTLRHRHGDNDFLGYWEEKHWMNTPGPLYCLEPNPYAWGVGAYKVPNNVGLDSVGSSVIYRQPVNSYELHRILEAAHDDEPETYGADGELHWTYETVKAGGPSHAARLKKSWSNYTRIRLL
jgi:hypothetical protein